MIFRLAAAVLTAMSFGLPVQGAETDSKAAKPLGKLPGATQAPKASRVPEAQGKSSAPLPSFVIPRDTCQQGEPLQALPRAKP